jgi:hypothetical protein
VAPVSNTGSEQPGIAASSQSSVNVRDPLANIREAERKRVVFDYRPESADPDKLI